jgi:hypothetical protein
MVAKLKRGPVSLALQQALLRTAFPRSRTQIRRSQLAWEDVLTPTSISNSYLVRIMYQIGSGPRISVLNPKLQRRDGVKPPHLYSGDRLCLYLPGAAEWANYMVLADTIVPWISEWLLYYEIWLATGEWCGGGVHPSSERRLRGPA